MSALIRRVVTGHASDGSAVVASDADVPPTASALMPGYRFDLLWSIETTPVFPDDGRPGPHGPYFPPVGGLRFLQFTIPATREPPAPGTDLAAARADAEARLPGLLGTMEPDNPGMHRSDTIDFVYVVEGEIWLELDAGRQVLLRAGDAAVQNGTRHAWRNRSGRPCRLLVVMAGARRTG